MSCRVFMLASTMKLPVKESDTLQDIEKAICEYTAQRSNLDLQKLNDFEKFFETVEDILTWADHKDVCSCLTLILKLKFL